jgi:hypothetical protein
MEKRAMTSIFRVRLVPKEEHLRNYRVVTLSAFGVLMCGWVTILI